MTECDHGGDPATCPPCQGAGKPPPPRAFGPNVSIGIEGDEFGNVRCPICPPAPERPGFQTDYGSMLYVVWETSTDIDSRKPDVTMSADDASTSIWYVACSNDHRLLSSHDMHSDDELPPAPTWDDIEAWLRERRPPIIRDHRFRVCPLDSDGDGNCPRHPDGCPATCFECEQPRERHEG